MHLIWFGMKYSTAGCFADGDEQKVPQNERISSPELLEKDSAGSS
jgi:hypothetical protein